MAPVIKVVSLSITLIPGPNLPTGEGESTFFITRNLKRPPPLRRLDWRLSGHYGETSHPPFPFWSVAT